MRNILLPNIKWSLRATIIILALTFEGKRAYSSPYYSTRQGITESIQDTTQYLGNLSIEVILKMAESASFNLNKGDSLFREIDRKTIDYKGSFDYYKQEFTTRDSLDQKQYFNFTKENSFWRIGYNQNGYIHQFYFFDTLNYSFGIALITYFSAGRNTHQKKKAPGFILIDKLSQKSYFIGLRGEYYVYHNITTIMLLDKNINPVCQIRYGRLPAKPPRAEFLSYFVYGKSGEYLYEQEFIWPEATNYSAETKFADIVICLENKPKEKSGALKATVNPEYLNVLPFFWSSTVIYNRQ